MHADRVGAQPQRLLDMGDQILRVRIRSVPRAHAQMHDQRHVAEPTVVDVAEAALVQHHGVDSGAGELTEQGIQIAAAQRSVGDGMIEWYDEQTPVAMPEQASQAEAPGE